MKYSILGKLYFPAEYVEMWNSILLIKFIYLPLERVHNDHIKLTSSMALP